MMRIMIAHRMMLGGTAWSNPVKNFKWSPTGAVC